MSICQSVSESHEKKTVKGTFSHQQCDADQHMMSYRKIHIIIKMNK